MNRKRQGQSGVSLVDPQIRLDFNINLLEFRVSRLYMQRGEHR